MKWQRHLSGVGIGVRILSLQIGIATAADLDSYSVADHVMVRGSNSGSIRTSSSYIDEDTITTANDTTHDQVLKGQSSSPHHRRVSQKKHKPRIKRRLGIDVNVEVSVSVQVGEDTSDSNINEVGEDIPDSNINVFDDSSNGNNKLQSFSSPSDENLSLSTINDMDISMSANGSQPPVAQEPLAEEAYLGYDTGSSMSIMQEPPVEQVQETKKPGHPPGINKLKQLNAVSSSNTNKQQIQKLDTNTMKAKGGRGKKTSTGNGVNNRPNKKNKKGGRGKKKNGSGNKTKKTNGNQPNKNQSIQKQPNKNQSTQKQPTKNTSGNPQTLKQQYMAAMSEQQLSEAECSKQDSPYRTCLDTMSNSETTVHTCQAPFTRRNEKLINGEMYLSLLQDSTLIVPNTVQQMEEYTLSYLADNIGGRLFEPVCVQVLDDSYQTSSNRNRNTKNNVFNRGKKNEDEGEDKDEDVESNTLLLLVTYIQKMGPTKRNSNRRLEFTNSTFHQVQERLLQSSCTPLNRAQCCSQSAINTNAGAFCTSIGCDSRRCGRGRQPRRANFFVQRRILKGQEPIVAPFATKGKDYCCLDDESLKQRTKFDPMMTLAELDVKNIDDVAVCSANRYSIMTVSYDALLVSYPFIIIIGIPHHFVCVHRIVWYTDIRLSRICCERLPTKR